MSETGMTYETLTYDVDADGVATITLDRPEAMNAVSTQMATALTAAGAALADDTSVRAVVLTSSHDKAFCVGADLKERNGFTDERYGIGVR